MAQTRNFAHNTNTEFEGVEVAFFTVDFINAMNAETGDPAANSNTAGLELARQTIGSYINILGEGPLADSNTQKTYMVRADALGDLVSGNTLRDAIRALNGTTTPGVTATISSATVTATDLGILTAAAI
jgi:hypothetical protein|tara:strand:+ start:229 stop:615 length:387 start_codon:yes stop_codon:yes gene_type:complete